VLSRRPFMPTRTLLAALGVTFLAGFTAACYLRGRGAPPAEPAPAVAELRLEPDEKRQVEVFRDVHRAVVNISNIARVRTLGLYHRDERDVPQGSGSGFVWDKKGHIVTNFHVVADATRLNVTLHDQSVYPVTEVIGVYQDKDIAILKIDAPAEKLHPIRPGSSGELLVGMKALAIGNPFGLDHTLTIGTVSALGREMTAPNGRRISDVIQTDAEINRGNSGGPLLNSRGELIGITTAIITPSGVSAGIAFAVPVDAVRPVVEDFIEHGRYRRPGLGITLWQDSVTQRWWDKDGVWVRAVARDSAAAKSGLRGTVLHQSGEVEPGDLITGVGGKPVRSSHDLLDHLERLSVGDEVSVEYLRDGKTSTVTVRLQEVDIE
jgi:S1-C subfamily serine protease